MIAREYIQHQIGCMLRFSDGVIGDLTQEQLNWAPPGTTNTIGITLIHSLHSEDRRIQAEIQGKPRIWENGGWEEKFGFAAPGQGKGWEEARSKSVSLDALLSYQEAVRAATDAYVANLTPDELDRPVLTRTGEQPVAQVLAFALAHTTHHIGEVAVLKGVQGAKGLPF